MARGRRWSSGIRPVTVAALLVLPACTPEAPGGAGTGPGRPDDDLLRLRELQEVLDLQVERRGAAVAVHLADPDPRIRARAAFALGSVRTAVRPLIEALQDPSPAVREDAAWALGLMEGGDGISSALMDALAVEGSRAVRGALIEALGRVGEPDAVDVLATFRDPRNEVGLVLALGRALLRGVAGPAAVDRLAAAVTHPDPDVRLHAAWSFGRLEHPVLWARHEDRFLAVAGAYARDDPAAIHLLRALARARTRGAERLFATRYAESRDWRIRQAAVEGLLSVLADRAEWPEMAGPSAGDLPAGAVLDILTEAALGDPSAYVRSVAGQGLAASGHEPDPGPGDAEAATGSGEAPGREASSGSECRSLPPWLGRSIAWSELRSLGPHPLLHLETERGTVVVRMDADEAPMTVQTVAALAASGCYDGTPFHRVVPNFVAQGGAVDRGTGQEGPGFSIRTESTRIRYRRGTIGMARAARDTEGSQFFITHSAQPHLDGEYTAFGHVVEGMEAVDRIQQGDRVVRARVEPGR